MEDLVLNSTEKIVAQEAQWSRDPLSGCVAPGWLHLSYYTGVSLLTDQKFLLLFYGLYD